MKQFIGALAVILFAIYGNVEAKLDENFVSQFFEERATDFTIINDVIEMADKAKQNCPDFNTKIKASLVEIQKCTEEIKIGPSTICEILKTNVITCLKPLKELLIKCLPQESKELPILLEKIMITNIKHTCSLSVEEVLEYFNPCLFNKSPYDHSTCKEMKTTYESFQNKLPSKDLVCSLLSKSKSCTEDIIKASCSNPITKRVFDNTYQALDENTKDICNKNPK